jgi:ribosomal protein S8
MINLLYEMLNHIKNGISKKHNFVFIKYNKKNHEILKILTKHGYIFGFKIYHYINDFKYIKIYLRYKGSWIKIPYIYNIKNISKPSQRIYTNYKNVNKIINSLKYNCGIGIISTTLGFCNHYKLYKYKKGGEFLCYFF